MSERTGKKIALLVGGWSAERPVSLEKGKAVEAALREGGYDVSVIDVKKDLTALQQALTPKPDVVFNNLYGRGGEDGQIQSLLEILEIPYTHSGVTASAIGMDKPVSKKLAEMVGVQSPKGVLAHKDDVLSGRAMDPPYVVKPANEGSSFGVYVVSDHKSLPFDEESWAYDDEVLVERFIPGRELTVAVLEGKAQAVTEIVSKAEFFDYNAKYRDDSTDYILPAKIPDDIYNLALKQAENVYNVIGCAGLARCDFRYDDSLPGAAGLYFLEINTQPGLTADSIGPSQLVHNGMSFVELCSHLVETATCQAKPKTAKQKSRKTPENQAKKRA